jgi:hypothetical protein
MIKGTIRLFGITFMIAVMQSCGEVDLIELNDFNEQRLLDERLIADYLEENNFSNVDSTESGIKYVILEQGEGAAPIPNEFVAIDFYNQDFDNIVYASNMRDVADTSVFVPIGQTFEPIVFTYSQSGWTLDFVTFTDELLGDGLKEAIGQSFSKMGVGGHVLVLVPSGLAYGPNPNQGRGPSDPRVEVPANTVLIYNIFLRDVIQN